MWGGIKDPLWAREGSGQNSGLVSGMCSQVPRPCPTQWAPGTNMGWRTIPPPPSPQLCWKLPGGWQPSKGLLPLL